MTMIKEHNATTGEIIEREMNAQELELRKSQETKAQLEAQAEAQKATDKAALLVKLGLTESEAALLLS